MFWFLCVKASLWRVRFRDRPFLFCWAGTGLSGLHFYVNCADSFPAFRIRDRGKFSQHIGLQGVNQEVDISVDQHVDQRPCVSDLSGCQVCPVCGQRFTNMGAWIRHKWKHRDYSLFRHQCWVCNRKFYRKDYLTRHVAKEHPNM